MPSMPSHAHDNRAAAPGPHADLYDAVYGTIRWQVPARFNMAQVCLRRWADGPDQAQALDVIEDGPTLTRPRRHSYGDLAAEANRLSNALRLLGVQRGDRVAIQLPQRFETAVAYMAVLQMGAVAVPLSQLFGPEALEYRLQDSAAVVALVDEATGPGVQAVRARCADPAAEFDPALVAELQQHVRGRLAPYEYPKEIEFIDALPMTTTGKVQRRVLRLQEEARARERASAAASA